jgi:hypothetical protein
MMKAIKATSIGATRKSLRNIMTGAMPYPRVMEAIVVVARLSDPVNKGLE